MLHFRVMGEGPALVMVHGLFGSYENLGSVARLLSQQGYTVYSVDLPNHGRSFHASQMNLTAMTHALTQWMEQQALTSAHWVGHSLGGKISMEMALLQPQKVNQLVVIDIAPVAYGHRHIDVFNGLEALQALVIDDRTHADELLKKFVPELAVRQFLLKNLVKNAQGYQWRININDLKQEYPDLIRANAILTFDKPTLFIKGALSDYILPDYQVDIERRFKQAQYKIVQGAGHWLHADKPELTSNIIQRFLSAGFNDQ